jgi:hypothetical protein
MLFRTALERINLDLGNFLVTPTFNFTGMTIWDEYGTTRSVLKNSSRMPFWRITLNKSIRSGNIPVLDTSDNVIAYSALDYE